LIWRGWLYQQSNRTYMKPSSFSFM
jgi:hypothetical protein